MTVLAFVLVTRPAEASQCERIGSVTALTGHATVTREIRLVQPLKLGDQLCWGDLIETRTGGTVRIVLNGKITLTGRELSRLRIRQERGALGAHYVVDLLLAKARASVARALLHQPELGDACSRNAVASIRG